MSNGPCNDSKFLNFTLYDATTDTASNLLADSPRIPSASWPGFADSNANNLPDAVDKYPTFLKNAYPGLTPRSRAYGSIDATIDPVVINRAVNVLVFDPGTALPGMSPMSASLGYIVVVVPQDPTAPAAASTITDQCSPFGYTRQDRGITQDNPDTAANEGGFVYRTNPAAQGTYKFFEYLRSERDFDNDGIENVLDTCPYVSTPSWNPRISDAINDPDGDGIPGQDDVSQSGEQLLPGSGCDPTPVTASIDPDGDGFMNRQDNCPLVNATQDDPDADGIGSACDVVDTAPDGHLHEVCSSANVDVGAPGTPITLPCPKFILDVDGDGFTDDVEAGTPLCTESPARNDDDKTSAGLVPDDALVNDGCPAMGLAESGANCSNATDNDGDGYVNDGCPQAGAFSEAQFKIGTSHTDRCGVGDEGLGLPSAAWPSDLYSGGTPTSTDKINILDLTSFVAPSASRKLDTAPGQTNFNSRWDLSPGRGVFNNMINVADLTALIAGSSGFPPMLEGAKAFNGPTCPGP